MTKTEKEELIKQIEPTGRIIFNHTTITKSTPFGYAVTVEVNRNGYEGEFTTYLPTASQAIDAALKIGWE